MALSRSEEKRVLEVLEGTLTGYAAAYCMEHLASRVGLPSDKLNDLRTFVRVLRGTSYTVEERGVCDTGPHAVTDLVIRARAPGLPTRS